MCPNPASAAERSWAHPELQPPTARGRRNRVAKLRRGKRIVWAGEREEARVWSHRAASAAAQVALAAAQVALAAEAAGPSGSACAAARSPVNGLTAHLLHPLQRHVDDDLDAAKRLDARHIAALALARELRVAELGALAEEP